MKTSGEWFIYVTCPPHTRALGLTPGQCKWLLDKDWTISIGQKDLTTQVTRGTMEGGLGLKKGKGNHENYLCQQSIHEP